MSDSNPSPSVTFVPDIAPEEWRAVAHGLHAHLLRAGRRQKDLAQAAGMASSNLCTYLNLRRMPSRAVIRRVLSVAVRDLGVTPAMIEHWRRQLDDTEIQLRERVNDLVEAGVEFTEGERERLLSAVGSDRALARSFTKLAEEIRSLRSHCSQLSMAHTDTARESLVQAAVEAFQLAPRMRHLTREVERDIRHVHAGERRRHATPLETLQAILRREGVRIERAEPDSPRAGRGRWEGLRWLLSLKDAKRATITTQIHPEQYGFELGRVVGHLRLMRLLGAEGHHQVDAFAADWVKENFPQVAAETAERTQLEQDIVWLIFRSLAGRWATGFFTLPNDRFVRMAESCGYDVDALAADLSTSWETVVNRISQLDAGLPVHFVKMDWRGVVLKRSSFSGLRFAPLYMRVCGRWASARSLLTSPGTIVRQYSAFPDLAGQVYFCVSRSVRAPSLRFGSAPLVYGLTIGTQASNAHRLAYSRSFTDSPVDCGVTCRLCTVLNCENRVCPSVSQPGMGKFDFNLIWSGKTIHERFPSRP